MTSTRQNRLALKRLAYFLASSAAFVATTMPREAHAQRVSPLADAPAIRKREELRSSRFEIGPGFGSTVGQDYYHSMFLDLKLDGHINDWLSIGVHGGFAVANLQTAYGEQLVGSLHDVPPVPREPSAVIAKASMEKIKAMAAGQLEFTPFTGKFSLAGKVFAHYDFYGFAGIALLSVAPTDSTLAPACISADTVKKTNAPGTGPTSCSESGLKFGPTVGVGAHAFIKQGLAIGVALRDVVARLTPSGRDVNGDGIATTDDVGWHSTYMVTGNILFYLPSAAVISQ